MSTVAARETPVFVDPPLVNALNTGNIQLATSLLQDPTTIVNEPDHQGLHPIHWACFLRLNTIIEALLKKYCQLDQGPLPSALYECSVTNGRWIFERAKKIMLLDTLPFALCVPHVLTHLSEICTNLGWNNEKNLVDSFWAGRENSIIDPLILLDLKKVSYSLPQRSPRFFQQHPADSLHKTNHPTSFKPNSSSSR